MTWTAYGFWKPITPNQICKNYKIVKAGIHLKSLKAKAVNSRMLMDKVTVLQLLYKSTGPVYT